MSYIVDFEEYGRKSSKVDLPSFARDLAKALDTLLTGTDVKLVKVEEYPHEHQSIMIGTDRLDVRTYYSNRGRVTASITAPDVPHGDWSTYDKEQRTEDATVNPDGRSIETIARDINKRVIEANKPALAKRRAYAAQQAANRNAIVKHAADLKAAVPGLDIRVNEREQRAAIYGGDRFAGYLAGTLHSDGSVSLERLSGLSNANFRKIAKLLETKGGER